MATFRTLTVMMTCIACLCSCKTREAEPEHLDKIFADLKQLQAANEKAAEDFKKQIESVEKKSEKLEANSLELVQARKELAMAKTKFVAAEQLARFYKIRAEKRKFEDRVSYDEAFSKGEEWPPKDEYEEYSTNKKLRSASLDWQTHLPNNNGRYSKNKPPPGKAENKEKKAEEGE